MSLTVAMTIRTDHYEPLQTAPQLADVDSVVFDDLKPMPEAVCRGDQGARNRTYVDNHKLEIEETLVEQLVEDCRNGADALPLLSLTLAKLYKEYGSDGKLELDEYQAWAGSQHRANRRRQCAVPGQRETA